MKQKAFSSLVRGQDAAIAQLSKVVETFKDSKAQSKAPALVPISREARRMKLSSLNKESKQQ